MPNNTYKSAAVPFVNQKGERSMKRVKVERYVAGKRPGYAKDEDDEFYTSDEEQFEDNEVGDISDRSEIDDDEDRVKPKIARHRQSDESPRLSNHSPSHRSHKQDAKFVKVEAHTSENDNDEDDDDDPRFRLLKKQEKSDTISKQLPELPTSSQSDTRRLVLDDEEDEEETRRRHALARSRDIGAPIGPQAMFGDLGDQRFDLDDQQSSYRQGGLTTDDILANFKPSGLITKKKKEYDEEHKRKQEDKLKEMLNRARDEATFVAQVHKRIDEDNKMEAERELRNINDVGSRDMEAVDTDDDDPELAYEEWKLREIERVKKDCREKAAYLASVAKSRTSAKY